MINARNLTRLFYIYIQKEGFDSDTKSCFMKRVGLAKNGLSFLDFILCIFWNGNDYRNSIKYFNPRFAPAQGLSRTGKG